MEPNTHAREGSFFSQRWTRCSAWPAKGGPADDYAASLVPEHELYFVLPNRCRRRAPPLPARRTGLCKKTGRSCNEGDLRKRT